jgi:hypothetical protein
MHRIYLIPDGTGNRRYGVTGQEVNLLCERLNLFMFPEKTMMM